MTLAKKARNRLDARLKKLQRKLDKGVEILGGDYMLGTCRASTHALLFVEGSPPVAVKHDEALRRLVIEGWPDDLIKRWRDQLHDRPWGGFPTFYILPACDADGGSVCLSWEVLDNPEPEPPEGEGRQRDDETDDEQCLLEERLRALRERLLNEPFIGVNNGDEALVYAEGEGPIVVTRDEVFGFVRGVAPHLLDDIEDDPRYDTHSPAVLLVAGVTRLAVALHWVELERVRHDA